MCQWLLTSCSSQAGPVKVPEIVTSARSLQDDNASAKKPESSKKQRETGAASAGKDEEQSVELDDSDEEMRDMNDEDSEEEADTIPVTAEKSKKRKRAAAEDSLEDSYMRKLAKEEEKEQKKRTEEKKAKRQKKGDDANESENELSSSEEGEDEDEVSEDDEEQLASPPPVHESLANGPESEALERATRTVFLGNVSTDAIKSKSAKKTLLNHLSSFLSSLPTPTSPSTSHKIESIRFRSTAFASAAVPKRAAFAKKELMDATTRSTNAYVVYTTAIAARKALTLNGTIVLDRHLRVDSVAHPQPIDNKRCVFVGNLGFVDEQQPPPPSPDDDNEEKKKKQQKKSKPSSDIEEGLWRIFNQHSPTSAVESVRVVRDPTTRVGKGFAYVQFQDQNGVEAALLLDGKRFPPMLPRTLRVVRAKKGALTKKRQQQQHDRGSGANRNSVGVKRGRRDGGSSSGSDLKGRAAKLLGRAGAVQVRNNNNIDKSTTTTTIGTAAAAAAATGTHFVFEGHRATEKKDSGSNLGFSLKNKNRNKSKTKGGRGRPKTRSANRAKAYRDAKKGGGGK